MTDVPTELECCDDGPVDTGPGIPAMPPPCVSESCSIGVTNLSESKGTLRFFSKWLGGRGRPLLERVTEGFEEAGIMRCFIGPDGDTLGSGVSFFGNPATIAVECLNEDGEDLYVNPVRRIRNRDGSVSLGGLPIPLQGKVCAEGQGQCTSQFPPGEEGESYGSSNDGGCGPSPCVELTNRSCYPMLVTPRISVIGARLGPGVTYQLQPNVQGNFQPSFPVFSNTQGECSTIAAGNGDTSSGGDPSHTHEGPSHSHTVECVTGAETFSGTIDRPLITLAPGGTLKFCVATSIVYERTVEAGGELNFGTVTVCLDYTSEVTPETIAALEGA